MDTNSTQGGDSRKFEGMRNPEDDQDLLFQRLMTRYSAFGRKLFNSQRSRIESWTESWEKDQKNFNGANLLSAVEIEEAEKD